MNNEPISDMTVFVKEWSPRVRSTLMRLGIRETELLNDLEQDVYYRMIVNCTLEIYDPTLGASFSTHVYQVIRTIALNYHRAKVRNPLTMAESIEIASGGEEQEFLHPEVAKLCVSTEEGMTSTNEFLDLLYKELAKERPWKSGPKGGQGTVKSLSVICKMMHLGYRPKEIAYIFKASPSAVSVWVLKIRGIAKELRERCEKQ
jgi:hypothetical protein